MCSYIIAFTKLHRLYSAVLRHLSQFRTATSSCHLFLGPLMIFPTTFINQLFEYNSYFSQECYISHLLHCFDLEIRGDEYKFCIFSLGNFFRILTIQSK